MKKKAKAPLIACDRCGCDLSNAAPRSKRIGGLEYMYLKCYRCKSIYTLAVTDVNLRQDIEKLRELIGAIRTKQDEIRMLRSDPTVPTAVINEKSVFLSALITQAKNLRDANIVRRDELRRLYPLSADNPKL